MIHEALQPKSRGFDPRSKNEINVVCSWSYTPSLFFLHFCHSFPAIQNFFESIINDFLEDLVEPADFSLVVLTPLAREALDEFVLRKSYVAIMFFHTSSGPSASRLTSIMVWSRRR